MKKEVKKSEKSIEKKELKKKVSNKATKEVKVSKAESKKMDLINNEIELYTKSLGEAIKKIEGRDCSVEIDIIVCVGNKEIPCSNHKESKAKPTAKKVAKKKVATTKTK